jgi:uncharacterized protein YndB with AHSA1/START domain
VTSVETESREEATVEVTREILVEAEPDEVWEALTDPARLEEWFANDVELEATPGGEGVFRWENGEERRARVEDVDVGRRFAFRWQDEAGDESVVAISLDAVDAGTRVVVTESAIGPQACAGEWSTALELWLAVGRSAVLA